MLPDEMQPPKTRFLAGDKSKETRSTSSPRLKSFPAEKIRKLDNSPMFSPESVGTLIVQQDPQETKTFASSIARSNNGHGDAISAQFAPCCLQPKLQGISSPSQQQIAANHQQISQANPQSESLLTRRIASPERQVHRPFVPIAFQGTVIRDRSPRNPSAMMNQPTAIQNPSTQITPSQMQQFSHDPRVIVDENRDGASAFDTYEKQPVGGRNTANHREMIMQMQQQRQQAPIARDTNVPLDVQSANNCHHMYDSIQQNPQQVYQQMQQSAYHPQTLQPPRLQAQSFKQQHQHQQQTHDASAARCAHYVNRHLSAVQNCGQGMTSPQDMTVSQMKLMQHGLPIHQQSFGRPVNLHSAWPQNDRWMQTASQSRQVPLQQPLLSSPSRCQCCYQMQAAPNVNFDQQTFGSQDQSNPPQNHKPTKQQLVAIEAANREDAGRKKLKFTPDMIRDQELLISTLRQQGVPNDVVRRHFDALLNEQRRHLAYIAQFSVLADADMEMKRSHQPAQKRLESDEKPEWMVHITPPRISYYELEKMRAQQKAVEEQCTVSDQPLEEIGSTHVVQQPNYHPTKQGELTNQVVPLKQMYFQVNPYQQQMASWSHKGAACCPHNHQQNALYRRPSLPTNVRYSYNMRHNPYNHPDQQKTWSEQHNPDLLKSTSDQRAVTEPVHIYEQSARQIEPSSLLKMRVYKEVIRPQKQNNGLQDPDTVQKALDALKDPTSRRGLEYLANLTKRKPALKLNGTQNSGEIPDELRSRPPNAVATCAQIQKRILANGLENNRNPKNPPPRVLRPKGIDEPMMTEYPRQRKNMGTRYSVQAERENGTTAALQQQDHAGVVSYVQGAQSIPYGLRNAPAAQGHCASHPVMFQYGGAPLQHHYQMQQRCYLNERSSVDRNGGQGDVASTQRSDALGATRINRAGGDTGENLNAEEMTKRMMETGMQATNGQADVREARTIGGVTYLPRKPDYACNNLTVSPNQLIASGHLQPPRIL